MTKIMLGQSYYLRFDEKSWKAMQPYPPLGTLYAASVLRQQGHDVALFDAMLADSVDEWRETLALERATIAVIYEDNFNYLSKMCLLNMRQAAFDMLAAAKARGCITIAAGSDATDHAERYLDAGADYVLIGEGERSLSELIDLLTGKVSVPLSQIAGLSYIGNRGFVRTALRPVIKDLNAMPFPAWDLVDVERYRRIWNERHGYYSMNAVTTRGCPFHCNWCAKPIWGQRYNSRSPENVVAELKWLKEKYEPDHIWFADDIMGLKPGWWQRFADLTEMEGIRIPFKCLTRADLLVRDRSSVLALGRAGCDIVWIGAESGSQSVLDAMEKGTTVAQIREASQMLREAGIKVALFIQFGYPGETLVDIQKTLTMVRECQPDDIGISVSYPLPGTKFHEKVRQQLGSKRNWIDSADLAMMYHGRYSTSFYRQLHKVTHKEYRWRRTWRELRTVTALRHWRRELARKALAGLYHFITLPFARARLTKMAEASPDSVLPFGHMPFEQAASPTPQTK
jgi:radical SAM superfamily enzyme YgiQ (UPF0313 family)